MLTEKEQAMVNRTIEQAKGMDKAKLSKIAYSLDGNSQMLLIEPGVYTTKAGKDAVIAAIKAAITAK